MSHTSTGTGVVGINFVVDRFSLECSRSSFLVCSDLGVIIVVTLSSTCFAVRVMEYVIPVLPSFSALLLETVEASFAVLILSVLIKDDVKAVLTASETKSFVCKKFRPKVDLERGELVVSVLYFPCSSMFVMMSFSIAELVLAYSVGISSQ